MAWRKAQALRTKPLEIKEAALDNKAWPESVVKVSNNIAKITGIVLCTVPDPIDYQ